MCGSLPLFDDGIRHHIIRDVVVAGFKGADYALSHATLNVDDADKNGAEHSRNNDVIFRVRRVKFVAALNESIGLKYALSSVEIEAAAPSS